MVRSSASFAARPGGIRSAAVVAHVDAQRLLEAVATPAIVASVQGPFRNDDLGVGELAVEVSLQQLLALVAIRHDTASSARLAFSWRRPRWSRDITVPRGISRI